MPIFSQLITNFVNLNTQLVSVTNLQADAVGIQQQAKTLILSDIENLKAIQKAVLGYTTTTLPALNGALDNLKNNNVLVAIGAINLANQNASGLATTIAGWVSGITTSKAQFISFENALTNINQTLQNQVTVLQSQAQDAQNQADYYDKRKYYFLMLGPFGLVGLATAIGMLLTWNNKANDALAKVIELNVKICALAILIKNVNTLIGNFISAVTQVSNIKNSIDFLKGDIQNVITDLNNSSTPAAILYLTTAIHEVQTLQDDAS